MTKLLALWSGDLALDESFWTWTVIVGLLVNIGTNILFLALILEDQPLAAVLVGCPSVRLYKCSAVTLRQSVRGILTVSSSTWQAGLLGKRPVETQTPITPSPEAVLLPENCHRS